MNRQMVGININADNPATAIPLEAVTGQGNNAEVTLVIKNNGANLVSVVRPGEVLHSALEIPAGLTARVGSWLWTADNAQVALLSLAGPTACRVTRLLQGTP